MVIKGYNPLMLGSNLNSDTGLNISFDTGYESPSVGAQIGQFGLGLDWQVYFLMLQYVMLQIQLPVVAVPVAVQL